MFSVFLIMGIIVALLDPGDGLLFVLFAVIGLLVGVASIVSVWRNRSRRRYLARHGVAAVAWIEEVGQDRSAQVNGVNAHKIQYKFQVNGQTYTGKRSTTNWAATKHISQDSIWVLYDPEKPSHNIEWPLL